jgi:hypothetical protein
MSTKTEQYRIERKGAMEYIVVRCPNGHLSQGQKVGDLKIKQTLTCAICETGWEAVLPPVQFYEAIE